MANWTAVTAFLAVGILVAEILYREYLRIKSRRIAIVDGIFSILTDNIRESMHNYKVHYNNPSTSFTNFLTLRQIVKNGEIEKIKKVDIETYDYLIRVKNEVIPQLFQLDKLKRIAFKQIIDEWVEYLEPLDHINFSHRGLASRLHGSTQFNFFDDDLNIIAVKYVELIEELIEQNPQAGIKFFPLGTADELISIAKKHVGGIKELDLSIRSSFQDLLEDKLLPRMATITRDTV